MRVKSVLGIVLGVLLAASTVVADAPQTGVVTGVIVDPSGGPLPGASVLLIGDRGELSTVADADGAFRFVFVVPGSYTVRAALEGFQTTEGAITVTSGGRADVQLRLGEAMGEEIVVTGEVPLVNRYDVAAATMLESKVAEELVFSFRNYQSAWTSMPGVVQLPGSTTLGDRSPSVGGGWQTENASFVDGVDVSVTRSGGTTRLWLPTTAMAEVRMESFGQEAEYGRVVGGINRSVTKSGTNDFHGQFLYVAQNQAWTSQSEWVPVEQEDELINSYEVSLGGPIVRDKAWFFVAAADSTTNHLQVLGSGEVVDNSLISEPLILKLDLSPTPAHRLALTGIDGQAGAYFAAGAFYDRYSVAWSDSGAKFVALNWSWALSDDKFLEVRGAHQESSDTREQTAFPEVDPAASPDDPPGNQWTYFDAAARVFRHGIGYPTGEGEQSFPRDQGNVSFSWFAGRHELKLGVDYQDIGFETQWNTGTRYFGMGYNEALPGGYARPLYKRVYDPVPNPVETPSTALNVFAQDRFDVGDRWTFNIGLRVEDQSHKNDLGETVISSTDLAPRFAAVYDVGGRGDLLVKGTLGRYMSQIDGNFVNEEFSTLPNGSNSYDQFAWNPATRRYDRFTQHQGPLLRDLVEDVQPFHKDEVTLGIEWQFSQLWVLKARAIYWEVPDQMNATDQFDADGNVYRLVATIPDIGREYKGLQLELNRRFRSNWVLRANYTLSEVVGNCYWNRCDYGAARTMIEPESGEPYSVVNRWGTLEQDQTHNLNISGAKIWQLGRHSINLGGSAWYRTGSPWSFQETVTLIHPASGQSIQTVHVLEPQGSRRLPDTYQLNLTGTWQFPIAGAVEGSLRLEAANVTDEQEQVTINQTTGEPIMASSSFQKPRELRVVVGVTF